MAKVILIDPKGWQGAGSGQKALPNIGIAYLIAALQKAGHQTGIIDLNNENLNDDKIFQFIDNFKPDIVGFSVKTATIPSARELAKKIKKYYPSLPLIIGGPHATLMWQELIAENLFDAVFIGEGEEVFPDICQRLKNNQSIAGYPGIVSKGIHLNEVSQPIIGNLDNILFPEYSLFPQNVQASIRAAYPLLTSRGCVYSCIFCSVPKLSKRKFRARSPENVIEELKWAKTRYNITGFEIIDDLFNFDIERCKKICQLLIHENLNLSWSCPNGIRADRLDEELAELMVRSGCRSVNIGVESGDPEVFNLIKKGETLDTIEKNIEILQRAGLDITGFFIIGLPGDSLESEKKSLDFVRRTKIRGFFNMLVPYPGTEVWEWVKSNARFINSPEHALHFADDPRKLNIVFETENFPLPLRLQAYEMIHLKLGEIGLIVPKTLPKFQYIWRIVKLLWKYNRLDIREHFFTFKMMWSKIKNKIEYRNW